MPTTAPPRRYVDRRGVDAARVVVSGSSAGGFTTLTCLTSADPSVRTLFSAGGSHYGVSDPESLARDTHKFESRYLDWLIAPSTAENSEVYRARCPVRNADRLSAPVAFFQGAEDRIVPPAQTELMVTALRRKGITAQYLLFAGEQHGFRQASSIRWALDAEFYFSTPWSLPDRAAHIARQQQAERQRCEEGAPAGRTGTGLASAGDFNAAATLRRLQADKLKPCSPASKRR
jgi:dienelactone hydrolase